MPNEQQPDYPDPIDTIEVVRRNVREIRGRLGMSGRELASRLEELGSSIDHSALASIESGRRRVSVNDLVELAAALRVTIPQLLSPEEHAFVSVGRYQMGYFAFRHWSYGKAAPVEGALLPSEWGDLKVEYMWDPASVDGGHLANALRVAADQVLEVAQELSSKVDPRSPERVLYGDGEDEADGINPSP